MAILCAFMVWYGTQLCIITWDQTIAEFPVLSVGLTYSPLPLGAAVTLLFVIEHFAFGTQEDRPLMCKGDPGSEEIVAAGGDPGREDVHTADRAA